MNKKILYVSLCLCFIIVSGGNVLADRATIMDLSSFPEDPRPALKRSIAGKPYLRNGDELYQQLNDMIEDICQALSDEDFELASDLLRDLKRKSINVHIPHLDQDVVFWQMRVLYDMGRYRPIIWLAEESQYAFNNEPLGPSLPGGFIYYFKVLSKTQGIEAAEQAYIRHDEMATKKGPVSWVNAWARLAWINVQLEEGVIQLDAVKQQLADEALADVRGLTIYSNKTLYFLVPLCLDDEDYDFLRRVAMRAVFENENHLFVIWETHFKPLWVADGKGPEHLIALTDEYLADCDDPHIRLRANYFKATMHRMASAMLYLDIMNDNEADKMFSGNSDLPFVLIWPMGPVENWALDSLVVPSMHRAPMKSLSQQAAHHLRGVAPGSHLRSWPLGPASDELRQRLNEEMLRRNRE